MILHRLDHLVLTVADIDRTIDFYTRVLGMEARTFGDNRKALAFGQQKINLHQEGREIEPKAEQPTPGSADLCFLTETDLETVMAELQEKGVPLLSGIVERTGALGNIHSVYFRDPDGNLLELSSY